MLREFQRLSHENIALALGCSLGTVKSRISWVRQALKEKAAKLEREAAERVDENKS